jgi:hypothetical protein
MLLVEAESCMLCRQWRLISLSATHQFGYYIPQLIKHQAAKQHISNRNGMQFIRCLLKVDQSSAWHGMALMLGMHSNMYVIACI